MKDAFRRGFADFLNYRYLHGICVVTIALSVFVISAFVLFLTNAGDLMGSWKKGIRIIAYLENGVGEAERLDIIHSIRNFDGVDGVEYVSSNQGLEWLRAEIGRQSGLLDGLMDNPLPDALEISLIADIEGAGAISTLADRISGLPRIADVEYAREWLERFGGVYSLFRMTSMVLISLIFAAVMMIVANTIRLILYSRIEEIKITRIIGANDAFIKYPLYFEGLFLGFSGGLAGLLLLYAAFSITVPQLSSAGLLIYFHVNFLSLPMILIILLSSTTVGWTGCYLSIRRFLKF
jgi:cell division transport system permease protein